MSDSLARIDQRIAILEQAEQLLAQVQTVEEAKDLLDRAAAVEKYLRGKRTLHSSAVKAAALKVKVERKIGELLRDVPKNPGGRPSKTGPPGGPVFDLASLGISKNERPPVGSQSARRAFSLQTRRGTACRANLLARGPAGRDAGVQPRRTRAMPLIRCPECHGSVSDRAAACPHCGRPTTRQDSPGVAVQKALTSVGFILGAVLLLAGWMSFPASDLSGPLIWVGSALFAVSVVWGLIVRHRSH